MRFRNHMQKWEDYFLKIFIKFSYILYICDYSSAKVDSVVHSSNFFLSYLEKKLCNSGAICSLLKLEGPSEVHLYVVLC